VDESGVIPSGIIITMVLHVHILPGGLKIGGGRSSETQCHPIIINQSINQSINPILNLTASVRFGTANSLNGTVTSWRTSV
jgi:hypothetical protein